jgi:putative hydrolase of the HAD superfamily
VAAREDASGPAPLAVIFDLFHTLVDPEEFRPRTFLRGPFLADRLGLDRDGFVRFWQESYSDRARSRTPSLEERLKEYCRAAGVGTSAELIATAVVEMGRYQDLAVERPHPRAVRMLREIRGSGIRTGLLSNCDPEEVRRWERSPLADCFDFVGFSCDLGHLKPEREAYEAVLRGLGAPPANRCMFVGDGSSEELQGARRARVRQVVLMRGFVGRNGMRSAVELQTLATFADYSVDQLDELRPLLGLPPNPIGNGS